MSRATLGASLAALLWCGPASAQVEPPPIDAHGFALVPDDGDLQDLVVGWRAEQYAPGNLAFEGIAEYVNQPLVLFTKIGDQDPRRDPLVEHIAALNVGAFGAVHERVAIGASLPVYAYAVTAGGNGPGVGDLRLSVPIHLASFGDEGSDDASTVDLSVVPFGIAPTGQPARSLGTGSVGGGGLVAVTWARQDVEVTGNIGARTRNRVDFENLTGGPDLLANLGVVWLLTDDLALRGEAWSAPNLVADPEGRGVALSEVPGEVLVSARARATDHLYWTAGLGTAFTRGVGAAPLRVFGGIGWTRAKDVERDVDGDGFVGDQDACPEQAETFNDYADDDGCPDQLATVRVEVADPEGQPVAGVGVVVEGETVGRTNSSGVLQLTDRMPGTTFAAEVRAPKGGYQPASIEGLELGEGMQTEQVMLEWAPVGVTFRAVDQQGDPVAASLRFVSGPSDRGSADLGDDGERGLELMPGEWTVLFSHPDFAHARQQLTIEAGQPRDVDVEMKPARVEVTEEKITITEKIFFEFDKAAIKPESMDVIEEVAATLLANPRIEKVEVQGHTSAEGTEQYNLDLSQRRVDNVVEALAERGVDRDRLVAKGYGESQPIATNETEAGREENRRVEFVIEQRGGEQGVDMQRPGDE